jgi:hypothetical protein
MALILVKDELTAWIRRISIENSEAGQSDPGSPQDPIDFSPILRTDLIT